jgi:hypothetical protein
MTNPQTPDLLISRVIDGSASEEDWTTFRAMADKDHSLWRELAECQRDHVELSGQVQSAIAVADRVDAPAHEEIGRRFNERLRLVAVWGGWAAAACLGIMIYTGAGLSRGQAPVVNQSGLIDFAKTPPQEVINRYLQDGRLTPRDLIQEYVVAGQEKGSVLREMPDRVLITARPMKSGDFEVTFIRQIMERTRIKEFNGVGMTDAGILVPVPIDIRQVTETGRY